MLINTHTFLLSKKGEGFLADRQWRAALETRKATEKNRHTSSGTCALEPRIASFNRDIRNEYICRLLLMCKGGSLYPGCLFMEAIPKATQDSESMFPKSRMLFLVLKQISFLINLHIATCLSNGRARMHTCVHSSTVNSLSSYSVSLLLPCSSCSVYRGLVHPDPQNFKTSNCLHHRYL